MYTKCCTAVDRKVGFIKAKLNKILHQIEEKFVNNCSGFFGLIYNFKFLLGSGQVWACIFGVRAGFGLDLVGPLTTLMQLYTVCALAQVAAMRSANSLYLKLYNDDHDKNFDFV